MFAVSSSHETTFELSSSHAINADTASFATNFTASGAISASGNIFANRFNGDGAGIDYSTLGDIPAGIISGAQQVNDLTLTINGGTF